jgi:hypothetical protein
MRAARLLNGSGENAPTEGIDEITEVLQTIVDPARIPSLLAEEAVTHLTRHITAVVLGLFGPAGLVVAVFVGKIAGELTHQALDADRNPNAIRDAESSIDFAGALADAGIDRLGESDPFRQFLSGLVSRPIAAIINRGDATAPDAPAEHRVERASDRLPIVTVVVAGYHIDAPPVRSGLYSSGNSKPAPSFSSAVLECVPTEAIASQWRRGSYEFLRLTNGAVIKRRIDSRLPGPWAWVSG